MSELAIAPAQQQKFEKWGQFGLSLSATETDLKRQSLEAIAPLTHLPDGIDQLPEAITTLNKAAQSFKAIKEARLSNTRKLDELSARYMLPEKELEAAMKTFEARITALKIEADKINRAKAAEAQAKADEEAKARQAIIDRDARFMAVINEVPGKALAHALENNIKMPELHSYLSKIERKYNLTFFEGSQKHYDLFNEAYARAFRDYDLALENKEIALKRQAEVEAAERAKAAEQTKGATLMNAMDAAIAPTVEPVIDVKIKRSYKAQIDTSEAWATTVWAAFLANRAKVIHKVRQADTRDWSKVTAVQLAEALAAVKNDDNAFDVKGVVFVEEVK